MMRWRSRTTVYLDGVELDLYLRFIMLVHLFLYLPWGHDEIKDFGIPQWCGCRSSTKLDIPPPPSTSIYSKMRWRLRMVTCLDGVLLNLPRHTNKVENENGDIARTHGGSSLSMIHHAHLLFHLPRCVAQQGGDRGWWHTTMV
jgi:hypothetical protein